MKDGKTALMMAAEGGHLEVVKALIEAGADVNLHHSVCWLVITYINCVNSNICVCQFYVPGQLRSFYVHVVLYTDVEWLEIILIL